MTKQIVLTGIILLFSVVLFEYSDTDIFIQDLFYNFELKQWALHRDDQVTKFIFYDGVKRALVAFILLIIAGLLFFRKYQLIQAYQKGLIIVLLSAILVPLSVGVLKATTNIPCPHDLKHYGGSYPHITLLKDYPQDFDQKENIMCYPAGHASGGFALLSLIFLFNGRRKKIITTLFVLSLGWSMGVYKILIGDHFLSHTVATMMLAWLIILIIANMVHKQYDKIRV